MLSLCICTRNRPLDVERCVGSLVRSCRPESGDEIVVIDDGDLADAFVATLRQRAIAAGFGFTYHRKQVQDGLYASRRVAASIVTGDVIVFLDDDVEVPEDFLSKLRAHYEQDSQLMGVGGVDVAPGGSFAGYLFRRIFLIAGRKPGRLSVTGMAGSAYKWPHEGRPFDTEFMCGFCMTYRRSAVSQLLPLPWLVGYSPGEDLLVSKQAARHGRLLIDPALQVVHHHSPTNRWDSVKLRSQLILLAIPSMRILRPTTAARVLIHWSILGSLIHPLLALRWKEFVKTLNAVMTPMANSPQGFSLDLEGEHVSPPVTVQTRSGPSE